MQAGTRELFAALAFVAMTIAATGCGSGSDAPPDADGTGGSGAGEGFVSDDPNASNDLGGPVGSATSGAGGGSAGEETGGDGGDRAIAEADIVKVHEGKLYALSRYTGLSVVDISQKDQLRLVGRYRATGVPFEMYLEGGIVYALYSAYGRWAKDASTGKHTWVQSSRVEALDVSEPGKIEPIGSFDLPGEISDSRIVGDVLYVVSHQDGACWGCEAKPNTTVTSLAVGDPSKIGVVDALTYASPENSQGGWWRRSVTVTTERMYVAGIEWDGHGEGHSNVQVIDISDPSGDLEPGATFPVAGQIESRWQMDEHEGILRVVSQPGVWSTAEVPVIQTFEVKSSKEVVPLASKKMVLPMPERLRSVRFDGARGYAITAVQTDPLFTIDLSDPADPKQLGELEIPGWVYHMEPRGDRILALGFDNQNEEGSLHVSLFDVSDMTKPTMIERVHFGGQWANFAEDQDRIHKAFSILDELGMILVPYSGWDWESQDSCGSYVSGIQIVDFTLQSLDKRGVAPARGQARRAFVHEGRMFAVSDEQVRTFDVTNRDEPAPKKELALANHASRSLAVGNHLARLAADWWTLEPRLEVVPLAEAERDQPTASLDLTEALGATGKGCWGWGFGNVRLFANGSVLYLVSPGNEYGYYDDGGYGGGAPSRVVTVDLADPQKPKVLATLDLPFAVSTYYGHYGYYCTLLSTGDGVVQAGSTLVFRRLGGGPSGDYGEPETQEAFLEVVDLSNPAAPKHASTFALPKGLGHTPLRVDGHVVSTSHWEAAGDAGKVKFFLDRISVADPAKPALVASVNVPGSLVALDPASGKAVTADYRRITVENTTWEKCHEKFGYRAYFEPYGADNYESGRCSSLQRTFKLLEIAGKKASLLDSLPLADELSLSGLLATRERVFAAVDSYGYGYYGEHGHDSENARLLALGGFQEGKLALALVEADAPYYGSPVAASGKRAVLATYAPPALAVLDASDIHAPALETKADLYGYAYDVTLQGNLAICSLGPHGVQVVPLD